LILALLAIAGLNTEKRMCFIAQNIVLHLKKGDSTQELNLTLLSKEYYRFVSINTEVGHSQREG